ncbi:N,N-dimethylformamidase beta subunit family domain-containing protein [Lentzea flaviverrucosa]|uniref:Tachylectin n=1 Tax=Lentzea flaviverrucosa TaxID=200379 RepID=A0A1H9XAP6_9PSEU|nr:N,N-dimethylformamidase beta subunit family domain-containing protein [Lentzea flaviverrucosa]RDI21687.1 tachylectin [Lentzea flaviverrucosa]SES43131.1 Tachylectin [Lentzea flaviverrucosa]
MHLGDDEKGTVARRTVLKGTAAALAGVALAVGQQPAAHAVAQDDPEQRLLQIVPGGNGIIYTLYADGRIKWFKHLGRDNGTYNWASGDGREIGSGWQIHTNVLADQNGQLFGLCGDGTMWWHKWVLTNPATGEGYWAPGTNNVIHRGFGQYSYVFGGWDGKFYAVDAHGDMYWFHYIAGDGSNGPGAWANNGVGQKIASEKRDYDMFFADMNGVIYGVRHGASLHWFRYLAGDGTNGPGAWANNGNGIQVGSGFDFGSCVERFTENGVVYVVWVNKDHTQADHELRWYKLADHLTIDTSGVFWPNGDGALVGTGFSVTRGANLQGYTSWSVAPGQRLDVAVSTTFDQFSASVLRLAGPIEQGGATQVRAPQTYRGQRHLLRSGYRANGPAWPTSFSFTVPDDWQSGFHVVKLEGPHGLRQYIPFVVKPKQPREKVALLLPYLTHNAYNHWGGHFQYSWESAYGRRQFSIRRPFANAYVEAPGFIDVRFYGDLLLMKWFTDNNVAYDCYQDLDLHDPSWLAQYKTLVLATHPEYWTPQMRTALETYLANGGRVIYTGGNGMYERVDYDASGGFVLHRRPDNGERWTWREQGRPESEVLGVAYDSTSYMDMHPYVVTADHPFLEGTGLAVGDRFGETGYNFAASGWEVDTRAGAGPEAPGVVQFAQGEQAHGAEMCVLPKPNGGWVFSASSLCFNGALAHDPKMSRILLNAVNAAQA